MTENETFTLVMFCQISSYMSACWFSAFESKHRRGRDAHRVDMKYRLKLDMVVRVRLRFHNNVSIRWHGTSSTDCKRFRWQISRRKSWLYFLRVFQTRVSYSTPPTNYLLKHKYSIKLRLIWIDERRGVYTWPQMCSTELREKIWPDTIKKKGWIFLFKYCMFRNRLPRLRLPTFMASQKSSNIN